MYIDTLEVENLGNDLLEVPYPAHMTGTLPTALFG